MSSDKQQQDKSLLKARIRQLILGFSRVEEVKLAELRHMGEFDPSPWDSLFDDYIRHHKAAPYSGLIEQQKLFRKLYPPAWRNDR